jgi:hypothetical protein
MAVLIAMTKKTKGNEMNEVIEHEVMAVERTAQLAPVNQTDRLIELAITSNASPEYLDKLLDLKMKHDKEEARKAYTLALSKFKGNTIRIFKDKAVSFNDVKYSHATLGNIINVAVPFMSDCGLSHRWITEQDAGAITVTCVLTHASGHSESTKLTAAPDDSGKKNKIQQIASTITYLERYTFLAITGLAVEEQDDDGNGAGNKPVDRITEDQAKQIHARITDNDLNMELFLKFLKTKMKIDGIDNIPVKAFADIMKDIDLTLANKAKKAAQ